MLKDLKTAFVTSLSALAGLLIGGAAMAGGMGIPTMEPSVAVQTGGQPSADPEMAADASDGQGIAVGEPDPGMSDPSADDDGASDPGSGGDDGSVAEDTSGEVGSDDPEVREDPGLEGDPVAAGSGDPEVDPGVDDGTGDPATGAETDPPAEEVVLTEEADAIMHTMGEVGPGCLGCAAPEGAVKAGRADDPPAHGQGGAAAHSDADLPVSHAGTGCPKIGAALGLCERALQD